MNIINKSVETGKSTIKNVWWFFKEELPQFLSNWRTVPRIMMVLYGIVLYLLLLVLVQLGLVYMLMENQQRYKNKLDENI